MGVRKNVKFLTPAERNNFVRACVMMKADIVNPAAPEADRYSRWDEYAAIHQMGQDAFAPGSSVVNFGHGGNGAYGFLSWHRYFLYRFELQLRTYVPAAGLAYWDWSDLTPMLVDTFLGPDGSIGDEVRSGYFARDAPGTPGNPMPAPAWWPPALVSWTLPAAFGIWQGALRRIVKSPSLLPTASDLRNTLSLSTYAAFQNALESGAGLPSFPGQHMHNGIHGWIGGHMSNAAASPFDPIFYLHHCNIDRLWAMWQMDGHADDYPATGGRRNHRRNDIMYPWTGGTTGYGTNAAIAAAIPMPDHAALGAKRNVDTLDFRTAFGYTYDTLAVIGVGLDRADSMNGMTPDPMLTGVADVSKWQAATRGVSAFLQDCETVQASGTAYVTAGIKTFRRSGAVDDFAPVFAAPGYGLVKSGGVFGRAAFDSATAGMAASGTAPLAEALLDVRNALLEPPFPRVPGERRYLAMFGDGLSTAGAGLGSIPDHSFPRTAVFAMGFGVGTGVDYANLASMVAKGITLGVPQVFHGENAGTIDKFFTNALARALGLGTIVDPVLELFEGEHIHVDFDVTSAEEVLLVTLQGMDFDDGNWTFHLHGPGGFMAYPTDAPAHAHDAACAHACCRRPDVIAARANGRLSLVLQRDSADDACWIGGWRLMVGYRARQPDAMVMPNAGELLQPVSAGPVRGPRYSRLLIDPRQRVATRNVRAAPRHRLDERAAGTNRNDRQACNALVNISGRGRLQVELVPTTTDLRAGCRLGFAVQTQVLQGNATIARAFARLFAPTHDLAAAVETAPPRMLADAASKAADAASGAGVPADMPREDRTEEDRTDEDTTNADRSCQDPALVLALLEQRDPSLTAWRDEELEVVAHGDGPMHVHVEDTGIAGTYHVGALVEGYYCPQHGRAARAPGHGHAANTHAPGAHAEATPGHGVADESSCDPGCPLERFTRVLTAAVALQRNHAQPADAGPHAAVTNRGD